MTQNEIKGVIKDYIKSTITKSQEIKLEDDTRLISGGIIDSISTLTMIDFLEKKFKVEFQPHEVDRDNLDTIDLIARFVESKIKIS